MKRGSFAFCATIVALALCNGIAAEPVDSATRSGQSVIGQPAETKPEAIAAAPPAPARAAQPQRIRQQARGPKSTEGSMRGVGMSTRRWRHQDVSGRHDTSRTWKLPLHAAAAKGQLERLAQRLGADDVEVDGKGKWQATALHPAAFAGHTKAVAMLLTRGATVDAVDLGDMTPLHLAALEGHLDTVKLLLSKGASPSAGNDRAMTPLHLSARDDHREVALLLIDAGSDVNALALRRWAPIHFAARTGAVELVEKIIAKGGDVSITRPNGWTALHHAAQSRQLEIVKLLVKHGTDVNQLTKGGNRPLHTATQSNAAQIIEFLISKGADPNGTGGNNLTALHLAASSGKIDALRALLESGARTDVQTKSLQTPLMLTQQPARSPRLQQARDEAAAVIEAHLGRSAP